MLLIISPAKTMDVSTIAPYTKYTIPEHLNKSQKLIQVLKEKTPGHLSELMNISSKLAALNYQRYKEWHLPFTLKNAKQAVFAFKGEVYTGLNIQRFSEDDLEYAQKHLFILSGLYGTLRPLDLIQPYRLEMSTKLSINSHQNLYTFWDKTITLSIQAAVKQQNDNILINLASDEYFRSIKTELLATRIITPVFKEYKNGSYKFISVYGKKARGMLTRFILQNRITQVDELKLFEEGGYYFNENLSNGDSFVFTRS